MKKPGQPESALTITAGRRILLKNFRHGVANGEEMSMAANWLRDLNRHFGLEDSTLEQNMTYRMLMERAVTSHEAQKAVANWILSIINPEKEAPMKSKANEEQPGGTHYKSRPIQHWDFAAGHSYGYLEGQITKYLFRWKNKGGLLDVQKADHFLRKLTEVHQQHEDDGFTAPSIMEFIRANQIPPNEANVMIAMHAYHETRNPEYLEVAAYHMALVLAEAVNAPG